MKKRKKAISRRTSRTKTRSKGSDVITVRRIIIFGSLVVLSFAIFPNPVKRSLSQSVAGVSVARSLFFESRVYWGRIDGAASYNVYYKKKTDGDFVHAVRNLSFETTSYTLQYLRKGSDYEYKVAAVDAQGKEYWWSPVEPITDFQPMQ